MIGRRLTARAAVAAGLVAPALPAALHAQVVPKVDSALASPRSRYDAGPIHRFLLGSHRRDLWALEIHVPVLDFDRHAGGITVTGLGGGQQTQSIRFRGRDGREYAFRSIDKDASRTLDPELRRSIAADVLQDQVSALLPVSAMVVAPLLRATGVLHADPLLVVMPDDPRLGEYREQFAGLLGFIEERPDEGSDGEPGFADATLVVGTDRLFERLEEDPANRFDERSFIRARLMDAFVGDWDRHPDQWRWAGFEDRDGLRWEPVPRDRDWALARLDGLLIWVVGFAFPNYVGFDDDYPSAFRLSWAGRALDRRLLSGTEYNVWNEEAVRLSQSLTDAVIDDAVRRMPAPYYDRIGKTLSRALKRRRDDLVRFAGEFYHLLAGWVDIHTTDRNEIATIQRIDGERVRIDVARRQGDAASGPPFYTRTFVASETREIRLWLHGGDDHAFITGAPSGSIIVRVLGGGSDDTFTDRTSGHNVHIYDDRGTNRYVLAPGTRLDESTYEERMEVGSDTHRAPARDWGAWWVPYPIVGFEPDVGLVAGVGAIRWSYGFRHYPWRTRLSASIGVGTGSGRLRGHMDYDFPVAGPLRARIGARYTGIEREYFFGFGNETPNDSTSGFYQADRRDLRLDARLRVQASEHLDISAGPMFRATRPVGRPGTLLDTLTVYGEGRFEQAGFAGSIVWDTRNGRPAASRGVHVRLDARIVPAWLDVNEMFAGVHGEGTILFGAESPASVVLALRAAGEKIWGDVPIVEAARVGGATTVRGYPNQRFTGQAAVYGNAELRLPLVRHHVLLPGHLGVFGLADTGRVFARGESSDAWHSAFGGGLWVSALSPHNVLSVAIASSEERLGVYVRAGFMF